MDRLTLFGMYDYDPTLFDGMVLPDGMDKQDMIDSIILKSGDLYPYYQVPYILKKQISLWFRRRLSQFEKMYIAITKEYNPIENVDGYENETISDNGSTTLNRTGNTTNTNTQVIDTDTHDESQRDTTVENTKSAYDSDTYSEDTKSVTDDSIESDGTVDTTTTDNGSTSLTQNDSTTNSNTNTRTLHRHGNVGVTSNQYLITEEIRLRKLDLYDIICSMFEDEIIVQVY